MENNSAGSKKINKKLIITISAAVLVVVALVLLWVFKQKKEAEDTNFSYLESGDVNPDFAYDITGSLDIAALKEYEMPMILEFSGEGCPPCAAMKPIVQALHEEYYGSVIIRSADIWGDSSLAGDLPITVVPTFVYYNKDGSPYVPSEDISYLFNIYNSKTTGEHALTTSEGMIDEKILRQVLEEMGAGNGTAD